jgi:hypothetical protein
VVYFARKTADRVTRRKLLSYAPLVLAAGVESVRLIIPYVDDRRSPDLPIVELAEFLGIDSRNVSLDADFPGVPAFDDCLVINSSVIEGYCDSRCISACDFSALTTDYAQLLVYGLRNCEFDSALVGALSGGRLHSIEAVTSGCAYAFTPQSSAFSGPFAGITFGRVDAANDHVMVLDAASAGIEAVITIDERPFAAIAKEKRTTVIFIASEELADLDLMVDETPLTEYFSRFVPWVMALRYFGGENCWHARQSHAAVVIDDPLLRRDYGFLNFEALLAMTEKRNFHAAIAFIPHNFRRSVSGVVQLFLENPGRLSICFHGNDHTGAEFASTDRDFLNVLLQNAKTRMELHRKQTGLACDPVMVFPQGRFSVAAMGALRAHNFHAAVNTMPHPVQDDSPLTLRELAQPAVLRYNRFPLFLRKPVNKIQREDIAFNVFFGRPVLIVEHHQDFKDTEPILGLVDEINRIAPEIRWSSLATATTRSMLCRATPNQGWEIRVFAGTVNIDANTLPEGRCLLEWRGLVDPASFAGVLANGGASAFECVGDSVRVTAEIPAGSSAIFSLAGSPSHTNSRRLDLRWKTKAYLRRRLSEFRDNHLYRSPRILQMARAIQHRISGA